MKSTASCTIEQWMRIKCKCMFIILIIGYWRKVPMDCLMMSGKAACSFTLQEAFRTGEGRMQMTRWISHTVKTESVDMRLATDLSVFAAHTTTQANSCVPPKKKLLKPKQIPNSRSHFLYLQLFHYTLSSLYYTIIFHSLPSTKKLCPLKPNFAHKCQNHIPPLR